MLIKGTSSKLEALLAGFNVSEEDEVLALLDQMGLEYRKKNRELSLKHKYEILDPEIIELMLRKYCSDSFTPPPSIEVHRVADSTNDMLLRKFSRRESGSCLCVAEMQTKGKGRRGRNWVSPFGKNIYISYGFECEKQSSSFEGLSVAIGIEVAELLFELGFPEVGLKWPNDIMLSKKKLGGILVELVSSKEGKKVAVVIGLGINLALSFEDAKSINQPWAEIGKRLGISRNEFVGRIGAAIINASTTCVGKGFKFYSRKWNRFNVCAGTEIKLLRGSEELSGFDQGVDEKGNLLLKVSGRLVPFNSGEVSINKSSLGN